MTAIAVLENLTQLAIGLENGLVLLIRGDLSQGRLTNPRVIHEGSETVTGLFVMNLFLLFIYAM